MSDARIVYIVDDDAGVRESIGFMLAAAGRDSRDFASAFAFLDAVDTLTPGCILLDMRMPGMDGVDLLRVLDERGLGWPVIIITGHGEGPLASRAMQLGAVDFVEKPFGEELLLGCLGRADAMVPKT